MFRLGLIVNPLAGLGGPAALKGSDGVADAARAAGGEARAGLRTRAVLDDLAPLADRVRLRTWAGEMGEDVARAAGFDAEVLGAARSIPTRPEDTRAAAVALADAGCEVILFAGGDGTARDLVAALGDRRQPVLGIPAGVKMHSGVFAVTPDAAARIVRGMLDGELVGFVAAEVRDIDEVGYRAGRVRARHFGELQVPTEPRWVQHTKIGGRESEPLALEEIAAFASELMDAEPEAFWIVGPGSTTAAVMAHRGLPNTLLGVDLVRGGALVRADATARQLLADTEGAETVHLLVTAIGGQGHVFGRGNQQLSPALIRRITRARIHVLATRTKLAGLNGRPLQVDTGDAALDRTLAGHLPVITGYEDSVLYPVGEPPTAPEPRRG